MNGGPDSHLEKNKDWIEVDMFDFKHITAGEKAKTTSMGPCLGLIIFDREKAEAIVGHFPDPMIDDRLKDEAILDMVRIAKDTFKNSSNLETYAGGMGPVNEEFDKDLPQRRTKIIEYLTKEGFIPTEIKWLNEDHDNLVMSIDTNMGEVVYDLIDERE